PPDAAASSSPSGEERMADPRFPIGAFTPAPSLSDAERGRHIARLVALPPALRRSVEGLDDGQLDTPYRDGGWSVRQVVHHVPDSHMNGYIRFKLALTETEPTIRPYDQDGWAALEVGRRGPLEPSLALLELLHRRWVALLETLSAADFMRRLRHPESGVLTLDTMLQLYAWHGEHHVAHIMGLREREGW
ncbi:MAG TPA: putative metal-dependent hydrolase, partial [Longimicrobiales bacterium]|nr:putative metal-dependent hydrolase [Longimicrobiales bacterium]